MKGNIQLIQNAELQLEFSSVLMISMSILVEFDSRLGHFQQNSPVHYIFGNKLHNFGLFLRLFLFHVKSYFKLSAKYTEIHMTSHKVQMTFLAKNALVFSKVGVNEHNEWKRKIKNKDWNVNYHESNVKKCLCH